MKNCNAINFCEKQRTSTIEIFWNIANSGIGGCFSTSINRMPITDSFFFIVACYSVAIYTIMRIESRGSTPFILISQRVTPLSLWCHNIGYNIAASHLVVYICTSIINLFQKKILHFCSSGLTLIFKTAGRKTVSLVVVEPVHALAIVAEEPVPRVSSIVLRRRPEEGVVR